MYSLLRKFTVQSDISAHREYSHNNLSDVQLIKKVHSSPTILFFITNRGTQKQISGISWPRCNQCLSPLKLWVLFPSVERCTQNKHMWKYLSVIFLRYILYYRLSPTKKLKSCVKVVLNTIKLFRQWYFFVFLFCTETNLKSYKLC